MLNLKRNKLDTSIEMNCIYKANSLLINRRSPFFCSWCRLFWKCFFVGIRKSIKETFKRKPKEIRTLCFFCRKPIHITRLGGVFSYKGEVKLFCNNFVCLVKLSELNKKDFTPCQCINVLTGKPLSKSCPICEEFRKGKNGKSSKK